MRKLSLKLRENIVLWATVCHMVANLHQLIKNYRFVLKIIELVTFRHFLVFAIISLGFLGHDEAYEVPRWLWLIYCINTVTYIVILISLAGSYVLEENCELFDAIVSVIGLPLYVIAGLGGIVRSAWVIPSDAERDSCELVIGVFFILIAGLMVSQIIWSVCGENLRNVRNH